MIWFHRVNDRTTWTYVCGALVLSALVAFFLRGRDRHERSLTIVRGKHECPPMTAALLAKREPILFTPSGVRECFGIDPNTIQEIKQFVRSNTFDKIVEAKEIKDSTDLTFTPRNPSSVHGKIDGSYEDDLPLSKKPPNTPQNVNLTVGEILNTTRKVQAMISTDGVFDEVGKSLYASTVRGGQCDKSKGTTASSVLWLSSSGTISNAHYDRSLNFVLAVEGRKKWDLWEPHVLEAFGLAPWLSPRYQQLSNLSVTRGDWTLTLEPGSALFVPPYFGHRVEALDEEQSETVISVSVLAPSEEEERWSNAFFKLQIFLSSWDRRKKLVRRCRRLQSLLTHVRSIDERAILISMIDRRPDVPLCRLPCTPFSIFSSTR